MSAAEASVIKSRPVERGAEVLDRVDYRLVQTDDEKDEIYRLRYRAYLNEGAIEANRDQRTTDRFDDLPNTWIFGIYIEGMLASSIRISVASPDVPTSPSVDVFSDLLKPQLDRGKVIVDPTRFVADPDRAKRFPELPYVTVRLGYVACGYFNADIGLATVRAEHRAFYRRVFLQEPLCEPRMFPGLLKPVGLMAADYPAIRERVFRRFPFMRSSTFERRKLFERNAEGENSVLDLPDFPFKGATIVPEA
jgi:N-acyl-L-homoserine lactone synthetase